jgi:PAS domain S-box-containing protein
VTELSGYTLFALREGPFTLHRGRGDGLASILLIAPAGECPSPGSLQRLEHEYALRTDLDGDWSAQPVELFRREGRPMLVLADPGGEPLERLLGRPMEVTEFLRIAVALAAAVGRLHARGLIHKDIKPANILVDTTSGSAWLTGFGIASRLPREHQAPAPPEVIAGTLAYMAPEQTGRMNRSVDSRSDLYALGVTFYEMLTGALPFTAADPMEWVHCHIARQPVPPDERVAGIPGPLSAIVLKLLAKAADDRYQTAAGLTIDLQRCLAEWQATGRIEPFKLGQEDASDRLLIPERLYGREREIDGLLAAFDRVVARGTPELVLVSGFSGIGKSSVVNELHKALVPPRGLFASGKFDQYKRDIPYATLAQAFQSLVRPLLGQSEAALGRWRDALDEALGPNGQVIVNLIPELELVIGKQPPVPDLPPQDAQNRVQMVFRRFLGVFARPEHPLALFLDDLQWLDTATLDLLEHLITHSEVQHLMLVAAYRDNEVGPAHPLLRTLEMIRNSGARVQEIVLAPLGLDAIGPLIADALRCAPEHARPLAQLVHEKTGGNPFFAIQFFTALAEEGLLALDPVTRAWQWDIDRIRAKSYTDNVVDLMAGKLQRLSGATQQALQQLACLGNAADVATLALVRGEEEAATHASLWEAVHAGFVSRNDRAYTFLHDRIQQAAYSLIPEGLRAEVHLRIGRMLLASMTAEQLGEHLFDVANQFNRAAVLLVDRDEKVQVATVNLRAGRKAKASAAYASASVYFAAGMAVLDEAEWGSEYDLMFALRLERAECAFPSGHFDTAEQLIGALLRRAASKVDQAAAYHLKVLLRTVKSEYPEAVASALTCLRLFGIDIPAKPSREQVQAEYETVWQTLDGRPIEGLIDLPLMTDPELLAAMRVLSTLLGPAYFTDSQLCCWLVCRMVKVSKQHGTCGASAHAYAYLGCLLGPVFHRYDEGYRFVRLACDLVEKQSFIAYQAKAYHSMGIAAAWTQPPTTAIDFNRAAVRTATETGDLTSACYSLDRTITILLLRNDPLDTVWHEAENSLDFVRKAGFRDVADRIIGQQRFIATMQGRTTSFSTFSDAQFDEATFEAQLTPDRNAMMVCCYWIAKMKALFISGDYVEALAAAKKAKALLWASDVHIQLLDYYYYAALTVAALYENASADEQAGWCALLTAHQDQLREWADTYPPTFGDKYALVSAEIARLERRDTDAIGLYEQAIQSAGEHGLVQNEALAHEVAARFCSARGFKTIAHAYLRNARDRYLRWGALGKVRQLEQVHPKLFEDTLVRPSAAAVGTPVAQFDIGAVVKASQSVSGEIVLDRLIETLMTIALEHAGAERALLILLRGDTLQIEAEATTDDKKIEVTLRQAPVTPVALPETVLNTVIRTQHSVILDDASAPNPFAADAYVRETCARSVLCLPLVKQAKLIGVLYLENNLASHVFTPARISVLELLASQAAISLENARLYTELQVSEDRWRNLFESVPVGVTLTGADGRYVAVNQTFQRMTGYSEAELRALSPLDITHEDDRGASEVIIAARDAGTLYPQHVEKRYRRKDGGLIWVDASAFVSPVVAGAPLFAGVAVDITDRKRAEEELRWSEASLAQAQEIGRTGSWRWKVGTGEVAASAEYLRIFGFDPATTQPSHMAFMERIHPEDRPAFERVLERAVQERSRFQHECRIVLPDGPVKHLQTVGQHDTEASDLEFVGAVMDVTERRRAEEALENVQAELARVARLTTLGEFAASLAHEIKQPLAAIVMNAEAGLRWLNRRTPDPDETRLALGSIVKDGRRAADVIEGIRALAKKSGPHLTALDIREAIEEVLALSRGELQRQGVVLHTDLFAGAQPVLGDRVQLQQVLLNLIMNAIQAMRAVTDRGRGLAVSIARADPDHVLVVVEDTGPGLDPALAQRIFEPFFTTKPDGLGMGLSICRSIIEAHGGRLWASPRAPHGTAFHFTVPIAVET